MEEINETNMAPAKLPQFLKVLCILTFVAVGLGLVGGLYNLVKAPYAMEEYERMQEMTGNMGDMPGAGFMTSLMDTAYASAVNALPLALITIGANLLCLFGALMMWKQRKIGFYVYVSGQLLAISIPAIFMGFGLLMALGAIFPIAFIIMYALNLKHMA